MTRFLERHHYGFLDELRAGDYVNHCARLRERHPGWKVLEPAPTARQFKTAREILERLQRQKGVLLADDVGLGKTTVAVLCALACANGGKKVRILAPNESMARRWRQELELHLHALAGDGTKAERPFVPGHRLYTARKRMGQQIRKLTDGAIAVSTHWKGHNLKCDLLIIDEAHRTRSESSGLGKRLVSQGRYVERLLVLTATPFSIDAGDLCRVLKRVGAGTDVIRAVRSYTSSLRSLWQGRLVGDVGTEADRLATAAEQAVDAMRPFVVRHAVDDLPSERRSFGNLSPVVARAVPANAALLDAMLRLDRALSLAGQAKLTTQVRLNDPRYHVGLTQMRDDAVRLRSRARARTKNGRSAEHVLVDTHATGVLKGLRAVREHPKVEDTVAEAARIVNGGEKVLIFCDHHRTATELALALDKELRWVKTEIEYSRDMWRNAWHYLSQGWLGAAPSKVEREIYTAFIAWLCSDGVRAQLSSWLRVAKTSRASLEHLLHGKKPGRQKGAACDTIAEHARMLFAQLTDPASPSTRAVLRRVVTWDVALPGSSLSRVAAVCDSHGFQGAQKLGRIFVQGQPDFMLAVFNSPFGPDVLVTTDRLSEGVDLHRFCRHLIHHELDPSPVRTVQRNGRLRRVGCWAARTGQPLCVSYPKLTGTRDEKLVDIMMGRLQRFDLLLGGVREDVDPDQAAVAESQSQDILESARLRLAQLRLTVP